MPPRAHSPADGRGAREDFTKVGGTGDDARGNGRAGGGVPARPGGVPGAGGGGGGRGKRRRVVIDSQASRRGPAQQGRDRRGGRGAPRREEKEPAIPIAPADMPSVDVASGSTVKDFADALGIPTAQIIKTLMQLGELATITQSLSDDAIELIAAEIERKVNIVRVEEEAERPEEFDDAPEDLVVRAPVVTVMGHVDHGKTSLLDAIRSTEVAAGEAGGITQHIGAYQVHHGEREITFLDTPGHEAFTAMRARGAKITDVAVIVVAADDGVMPQTVEAIDHARAAEVPFMVAVNKVDKPGANPDRVKQELSRHDVIPSEWGGTHEFVEVSALERTGIETLLETVLLVADADAEPVANPRPMASGTVIESRLDPGRGPVTSLLVQRGTLRVGDVLLAGDSYGRVRAMNDHTGAPMAEAKPSVPVEVLGLAGVPDAGERFKVVENERTARQLAAERSQRLRAEELANRRPVSLDDLFARIKEGGLKELNLIVKGDVQGSVGALVDAFAAGGADRGAPPRHPHRRRRHHRVRRDAGLGLRGDHHRLQRAAAAGGVEPRRARGRRHPHLPGHLPRHRGRARRPGRPARAGHRRGRGRPARGARDLPRQPARHHRRLLRHRRRRPPQLAGAPAPRGHGGPRGQDRVAQALQRGRPRGRRPGSSAAS